MLKSSIAASVFNDFSSNYQIYSETKSQSSPFVYVDPEGSIKLLTNVVEDDGTNDGIFAVSVAEDGWMEFLALQA